MIVQTSSIDVRDKMMQLDIHSLIIFGSDHPAATTLALECVSYG
jgi:hypothetical protein